MPAAPLSRQQLDAIHETVISFTAEDGLDGWRINDLVTVTGVSSRTLYKYFFSKEHLLLTSLVATSEPEFKKIRDISMRRARTPRTRVRRVLAECTAGIVETPELSKAMVRAWTCGQSWVPPLLSDFDSGLQTTIAYVMAGGHPSAAHRDVAEILEMVWVTGVIAWTSGVREAEFIQVTVDRALNVITLPG